MWKISNFFLHGRKFIFISTCTECTLGFSFPIYGNSVIAPPHKNLFFILRQANDHEVKCIAALELHVANHAIYHSNLKWNFFNSQQLRNKPWVPSKKYTLKITSTFLCRRFREECHQTTETQEYISKLLINLPSTSGKRKILRLYLT